MKALSKFPAGAARNADFVTRRTKAGRVIDFQVDLEDMPPTGLLCVHEDTIKAAVAKLGWKLEKDNELAHAQAECLRLTLELENIKETVNRMLEAV